MTRSRLFRLRPALGLAAAMSGIFALAYPVGGSFVVWFGGTSYDLWRSYLPAFGVSAAGLLLATVALLLVTRPVVTRAVAKADRAATGP